MKRKYILDAGVLALFFAGREDVKNMFIELIRIRIKYLCVR